MMSKRHIYLSQHICLNNEMMICSILLILLCFCAACDSENISEPYQDQAFLKYYGGTKNQTGIDIKPYENGWLLLGSASSFGYETETFYLLKVDQQGNEQWSLTDDSDSDNNEVFEKPSQGFFMKLDEDGGLVLLGETVVVLTNEEGEQEEFSKIFVAKVDLSSGSLEWSRIIRKEVLSNEHPGTVDFYHSEGYVIVGQTDDVDELKHNHDPETDQMDFFITRLDITGTSLWEDIYGFPYNDFAKVIKVEGNECTVMGNSLNQSQGNSEFVLSRYNSEGGILESKRYGTMSGDIKLIDATSLVSGDRIILYGYNTSTNKIIFQILDLNLNAVTHIFELDSELDFSNEGGIHKTNDLPLEFLISATVDVERDNNSKDTDIYLAKIRFDESSSSGNSPDQIFLWDIEKRGRTFGGVGDDVAGELVETTDGGTALIGTIDINTNTMMTLIRTNEKGELRPVLPE